MRRVLRIVTLSVMVLLVVTNHVEGRYAIHCNESCSSHCEEFNAFTCRDISKGKTKESISLSCSSSNTTHNYVNYWKDSKDCLESPTTEFLFQHDTCIQLPNQAYLVFSCNEDSGSSMLNQPATCRPPLSSNLKSELAIESTSYADIRTITPDTSSSTSGNLVLLAGDGSYGSSLTMLYYSASKSRLDLLGEVVSTFPIEAAKSSPGVMVARPRRSPEVVFMSDGLLVSVNAITTQAIVLAGVPDGDNTTFKKESTDPFEVPMGSRGQVAYDHVTESLYIADHDSHCIRRYRFGVRDLVTVAGVCGFAGISSVGIGRLWHPGVIAVYEARLFIADTFRVVTSSISSGSDIALKQFSMEAINSTISTKSKIVAIKLIANTTQLRESLCKGNQSAECFPVATESSLLGVLTSACEVFFMSPGADAPLFIERLPWTYSTSPCSSEAPIDFFSAESHHGSSLMVTTSPPVHAQNSSAALHQLVHEHNWSPFVAFGGTCPVATPLEVPIPRTISPTSLPTLPPIVAHLRWSLCRAFNPHAIVTVETDLYKRTNGWYQGTVRLTVKSTFPPMQCTLMTTFSNSAGSSSFTTGNNDCRKSFLPSTDADWFTKSSFYPSEVNPSSMTLHYSYTLYGISLRPSSCEYNNQQGAIVDFSAAAEEPIDEAVLPASISAGAIFLIIIIMLAVIVTKTIRRRRAQQKSHHEDREPVGPSEEMTTTTSSSSHNDKGSISTTTAAIYPAAVALSDRSTPAVPLSAGFDKPLGMSDMSLNSTDRKRKLCETGCFQKNKLLGRGANGTVYSCVLSDGSTVAVKEVLLLSGSQELRTEIQKEVDIVSRLQHPYVVEYYGSQMDMVELKLSLFMEIVPGGSLGHMVRHMTESLDYRAARAYSQQIVEAVAYIHGKGVVHRDLKCDNVLLTSEGICKLADFGASKVVGNAAGASRAANTMIGTPFFMAPEILNGAVADDDDETGYGKKADIWSLGITILELMNRGNPPWPDFPNQGATFMHIASDEGVPVIPDHVKEHAEVVDFIEKCCARDPRQRWTANELLRHSYLEGTLSSVTTSCDF